MQPLTILVVDDSKVICDILEEGLTLKGYQVTTTGDSADALKLIAEASFNVVITDLILPGDLDGIDILESAKKTHPDTAVILMSGYGSIDVAVKAVRKGAVDFMTKPVKLEDLSKRLEQIAAEQERRETLRAIEKDREQGFQDLEEIASRLHKKCLKAKKALKMKELDIEQRIERALKILSS